MSPGGGSRRALLISKGWVDPGEAALLGALLVAALLVGRMLGNDFRAHPSNFPAPIAKGARMTVTGVGGRAHMAARERGR